MQTSDALRAYFGRVLPAVPELFNMAYAICGNFEQAEYSLQYALTEASMVRVTRSIRIPEDFKDSLIILEYGPALIGVSFVQTGADTATATAAPIFTDGSKDAETVANNVAAASFMTFEE